MREVFNRDDEDYDKELNDYVETYHKRLSGDKYIMFDDVFSTYSILESLTHKFNNLNFLIISSEVKYPFKSFVPLSDLFKWSIFNELTRNDVYNDKDYHLSSKGHKELNKNI